MSGAVQTVVRFVGGRFSAFNGREEGDEGVLAALATETLTPSLACFGCVSAYDPAYTHFFGNFENLSLSFGIDTMDAALIERFTSAIRANISTPEYRASKREDDRRAAAKRARLFGSRPLDGAL